MTQPEVIKSIDSLETEINSMTSEISGVKTDIGGVKTGVDKIVSEIPNLASKLTQTEIKTIVTKIEQSIGTSGGIAIFNTAGTHQWTSPPRVSVVKLTMFGGGGSGCAVTLDSSISGFFHGGNGGAYVSGKPVKINPSTLYQLVVGDGGLPSDKVNYIYNPQGNAGGASTAFGIVCNGGAGGGYDLRPAAIGNNMICSKGSLSSNGDKISSFTPYATPGEYYHNKFTVYGGGAGYGSGGNGFYKGYTGDLPGYGAGSGGAIDIASLKGGVGIIILEW